LDILGVSKQPPDVSTVIAVACCEIVRTQIEQISCFKIEQMSRFNQGLATQFLVFTSQTFIFFSQCLSIVELAVHGLRGVIEGDFLPCWL